MANELLDFVMSLVRDPDVAARYAADPAATIAEANLSNVTSVDVNNLIPMVSDSLSMATPMAMPMPSFGTAVPIDDIGDHADNVWTSGAAAEAFEAFEALAPQVPETGISGLDEVPGNVIDTDLAAATAVDAADLDLARQVPAVSDAAQFGEVSEALDELGVEDPASWDQGVLDPGGPDLTGRASDDSSGFDLF